MKVLASIGWVIFSVLLIVAGVSGCVMPESMFESLVMVLPFLLIFGGVFNIVYYIYFKEFEGSSMFLLDGIFNLLFAILFLCSGVDFTGAFVVYFVAFLCMFRGGLGISYVFWLKKAGFGSWIWVLVFAILNIILAVLFIIYPEIGGLTIGFVLGFLVLSFGILNLLSWWGVKKLLGN